MPLIGAGDQGYPADVMLDSILKAAISWLHRGLPLRLLKIVVRSPAAVALATRRFAALHDKDQLPKVPAQVERQPSGCDVFLSYSHTDQETAKVIVNSLQARGKPGFQIFFDQANIKKGASWLLQVAEFLDAARSVVALYTPQYWKSPNCKDEFTAALARQNDTGVTVLYPIYLRSASIPYLFRNVQFADCREDDAQKLAVTCEALASDLQAG
jgi:hypothetical protein